LFLSFIWRVSHDAHRVLGIVTAAEDKVF
jgi:hypothetical protein